MFVTGTEDGIHVIDVAAGEKKEILPTKSMFGFDFVTKIVSLIDFSAMNASADQPFGNMLPLMIATIRYTDCMNDKRVVLGFYLS